MITKGIKWHLDEQTKKYANDITVYLQTLNRQTEQLMENNIVLLEKWRKEQGKYDRV